jgi:hypothetical protein
MSLYVKAHVVIIIILYGQAMDKLEESELKFERL